MEEVALELTNIQKAVDRLSLVPDLPLKSIVNGSPELKAQEDLIQAADLLHGTTNYGMLLDYVRSKKRPAALIPGTVGAFLYGCLDKASDFCSPLCINSIPDHGTKACAAQVWTIKNGKMVKLNNNTSSKAEVYSYDPSPGGNVRGLVNDSTLRAAGVREVVAYDDAGVPLSYALTNAGKGKTKNGFTGMSSFISYLFLFILIIAIIFLIYYIFSKSKSTFPPQAPTAA